ncbi:eCIS core domain-containing protein [Corallococcus llansteffanensis]|uniref:DUF4157 domain-containing protein n=1 Tax=Corallococcus llansteffanensis TaxID=2316731 RepID=A0A3A8PVC6_9BACT|nr:DUF4157 domain-containing protein [Corallococcus llansteffanensis]RKH58980.1 DUF4157 domain-containing protein [Corallococcus llansteffanensis]
MKSHIQRSTQAGRGPEANPLREARPEWEGASGPAVSLPWEVRAGMERSFHTDFSHVRLHTGSWVGRTGDDAATRGEHIFFRQGLPRFDTHEDRALLGHELTHVVRQRQGMPYGPGRLSHPGMESEADAMGERAALGQPVSLMGAGSSAHPVDGGALAPGPVQGGKKKVLRRRKAREAHQRLIEEERQQEARKQQKKEARETQRTEGPLVLEKRIYGHRPVKRVPQAYQGVVTQLQAALAELKTARRAQKVELAAGIYEERASFDGTLTRPQLSKLQGGSEFLQDRFGDTGTYVRDLLATNITPQKLQEYLQLNPELAQDLTFSGVAKNHETLIRYKGRHIYTLQGGASAFYPKPRATTEAPLRRTLFSKHGAQAGKEYVLDDRGVPTRRYAYSVKDGDQVGILRRNDTLRGRFISKAGYANVMTATGYDQVQLGSFPGTIDPDALLSENDMVFVHQEFGSSDRQRGVSIASSPTPLLSNEARGFADPTNADTQKLRIDLATIPRQRRGGAPNLINLYQRIPGFEQHRVRVPDFYNLRRGNASRPHERQGLQHTAAAGQQHFDWSIGKNREMFLRELTQQNLSGVAPPNALEDMSYIPRRDDPRAPLPLEVQVLIRELLRDAKDTQFAPL